jgi:nitrogen fixation/metabolism regulation signal transduction histidine kinase
MEIFFLWLTGTIIILAAYLSFLWWRPRRSVFRTKPPGLRASGRFQVRLTMLFLLFALAPAVPLTFLVSSLYTRSMEILLVPQIESSLLKSIEVIKLQMEERGRRFAEATSGLPLTPELLAQWQIDFCRLWRRDSVAAQLVAAVEGEVSAQKRILDLDRDKIMEVWGQTGSQLETAAGAGANGQTTYCHVWLPRSNNEMFVVGFEVDSRVVTATREITEAARVYNSLALLKESLLNEKILWSAAALFIMLLSAFSVWAARRFSHSIGKPIELLTGTMAEVAAGNLNARAGIRARDEIGVLVDSFNRMIEDLRVSREKLIASERLAAWRDVARQVSHEIKNPLTSIQLALYRLRQRFSSDTMSTEDNKENVIRESFQSLDDELAGLRRLADEFSNFARLPQADLKLANLNEVIQLAARLYEASGSDRVKIHLDLDPELPPRPLDREQMKRLLNNLLKNAIEATPDHRCDIQIVTRREGERAVLEVADNGPGLPPEIREHIFEPHFTTKRQGSGLGLVIVKRIVEEHGGAIEVESEPGKGTRFRVVI